MRKATPLLGSVRVAKHPLQATTTTVITVGIESYGGDIVTMKEAYAAATKLQKVQYEGAIYRRIIRCGYFWREDGSYGEFADVLEQNTGTIVTLRPDLLSLVEKDKEDGE